MNLKKQALVLALAVITALSITVSIVSSHNIPGKQSSASSDDHERTITGVWRTVITQRNCQTGEPGASFPGLWTFHEGGTMSEYAVLPPLLIPARRSPGHGVWKREHGWQDYSLKFRYYRYNASGVFVGSQKVTAALELGASGDEFTAHSTIDVLDANDNLIFTGCATAAGTRFE